VDQLLRFHTKQAEDRREQLRERRLTDPAEPERCQRDAELTGGQIGVEPPVHLRQQTPAHAVFGGKALHTGLPQLHQAEFGGDEKSVEGNEKQSTDKGDNLDQSKGLRQQKLSV
jgi:hypothetical protein